MQFLLQKVCRTLSFYTRIKTRIELRLSYSIRDSESNVTSEGHMHSGL